MEERAFIHSEIEAKKMIIAMARKLQQQIATNDTPEQELAAALIYMNTADYLAQYLANGFRRLAGEAMNKYFLGAVTMLPPEDKNMTLEESMNHLRQFDFAQKQSIMSELGEIKKARNKLAHEMLKTRVSDIASFDQAEGDLALHTERLIELVDSISAGLPPRTLNDQILADPVASQEGAVREAEAIEKSVSQSAKPSKKSKRK